MNGDYLRDGGYLRGHVDALGAPYSAVAARAGINPSTFSRILSGQIAITAAHTAQIFMAIGEIKADSRRRQAKPLQKAA